MTNSKTSLPYSAARSVYLDYARERSRSFYNEIIVERSSPGSFFMACGFEHGYFGLQQCGDRKLAIFSVWDDHIGDIASDVPADKRIVNTFKGEGVVVQRFGNEGTGGQSFFCFPWEVGQRYGFLVKSSVEGEATNFTASLRLADDSWLRLASFRREAYGQHLLLQNSFIEDFRRDFHSSTECRRMLVGNGWSQNLNDVWHEITTATYNAAPESKAEHPTAIDCGVQGMWFFLENGRVMERPTPLGITLRRSACNQPPRSLLEYSKE